MRVVDLRSDTITVPTPEMRKAMMDADVGDDVFGEDPTVNRLEALAAERLGKAAALFVASGTMGNLVSQIAHCSRGDEMILGDQAHIFFYEQGGSAAVAGIHSRTVPNQPDGKLAMEDITAMIRPDNIHFPRTRLIALENTHNRCSGAPLDLDYLEAVRGIADENGLKIHVDGARIFNAATALGVEPHVLAAPADSITFCLSKGLCAPVGSVVCGDEDFIARARRARKVLGGGMRQAGILAAAGILAITEMSKRLDEDHENAGILADGLAGIDGIIIDPDQIRTNIVFFKTATPAAQDLADRLDALGVRVLAAGPDLLRAVTHYPITSDDVAYAVEMVPKALK